MTIRKDAIYVIVILMLAALCAQFYYDFHYQPRHETKVYYSKDTETNKKLIRVIQNADRYVYFAIYTFTRTDIKDALLGAKHRGLNVRGVVDREQTDRIEEQQKIIQELQNHGIEISFDDHSGIMHLKTVVTEKEYASGSYNWTTSATESNDEILEVSQNQSVIKQYEQILQELFSLYARQ